MGLLSCLFVMLVYCGQTVRWIKMPFGMEVGLGPGDIILYGDPAPHGKGYSYPPLFGPCLLWPNSWMDRDTTWYGGRPRPGYILLDGTSSLHGNGHSTLHFLAHVCCSQTVAHYSNCSTGLLYCLCCSWFSYHCQVPFQWQFPWCTWISWFHLVIFLHLFCK